MQRRIEHGLPSAGSIIAGKYCLEGCIGSGGMGVVMRALELGSGARVAVKLIKPSRLSSPDAARRLLVEAEAAARLTSPHVVKVLDTGTLAGGTPFVVMELLEGYSFAEGLRARGPFPIESACRLVRQVCLGLATAHARGIVHRDLKPQNLFACGPAGNELAKILDFGLAKSFDRSFASHDTTSESVVLGSPAYMSPEQIRFRSRLDHRSDIWSLGVVLRELLTGAPPFVGSWSGEIFASVLGDLPQPMRELRADVPPELELAVARCLRKDPAERFAHVSELAGVLGDLAARTTASPAGPGTCLVPSPCPTEGVTTLAPPLRGRGERREP